MKLFSITSIALLPLICVGLPACSTLVNANLAMEGMPETRYLGESTVTTKFMAKSDVSKHCSKTLNGSSKISSWYNACVYKTRNGEIVMIMPTPGTMEAETYAKLLEHEYQHVGQAIRNEDMGHEDWQ